MHISRVPTDLPERANWYFVPGIAHELPSHQEPWEALPEPAVPVDLATTPEPPADHPRHESAMRGRYLAAIAGMCMECHTPPIGTDDLLPRPIERLYAGLTDQDAMDIANYILTLPPIDNETEDECTPTSP